MSSGTLLKIFGIVTLTLVTLMVVNVAIPLADGTKRILNVGILVVVVFFSTAVYSPLGRRVVSRFWRWLTE